MIVVQNRVPVAEGQEEGHSRVPPREMFKGQAELEIHEVALDTEI